MPFNVESHLLKKFVVYLNERPLKIMTNTFYFMLKAILVPEIFIFLS